MIKTHGGNSEKLLSCMTTLAAFDSAVGAMQLSPSFLKKHYPKLTISAVGIARSVVLGWQVIIYYDG